MPDSSVYYRFLPCISELVFLALFLKQEIHFIQFQVVPPFIPTTKITQCCTYKEDLHNVLITFSMCIKELPILAMLKGLKNMMPIKSNWHEHYFNV